MHGCRLHSGTPQPGSLQAYTSFLLKQAQQQSSTTNPSTYCPFLCVLPRPRRAAGRFRRWEPRVPPPPAAHRRSCHSFPQHHSGLPARPDASPVAIATPGGVANSRLVAMAARDALAHPGGNAELRRLKEPRVQRTPRATNYLETVLQQDRKTNQQIHTSSCRFFIIIIIIIDLGRGDSDTPRPQFQAGTAAG